MPKRKFELPGVQDLSKEQEAARNLPKKGQHLIVGGPGTGKSVIALLRARRHQREGDDYVFLAFNHLLCRSNAQLFGSGLVHKTWMSWFRETFLEITGRTVPLKAPGENGFRNIDWMAVENVVDELPNSNKRWPFLVIDEGQDMPKEFYNSLVSLGFNQFFVVADQNQQITDENSSREDIENCLAIEPSDVVELKQNYRNGYQIAKLAREFYTGDPASPAPRLPEASSGPPPLVYEFDQNRFPDVLRFVLRHSDQDPRRLIGIIAPNNSVRERYHEALRSVEVSLDNPKPPIETYHGDNRSDVVFDEGGILIINVQACKGLEFDTAVLADIDEHIVRRHDPDFAKRRFYVMVARAKSNVFMFMKRRGSRRLTHVLPVDPNVLRRRELR